MRKVHNLHSGNPHTLAVKNLIISVIVKFVLKRLKRKNYRKRISKSKTIFTGQFQRFKVKIHLSLFISISTYFQGNTEVSHKLKTTFF